MVYTAQKKREVYRLREQGFSLKEIKEQTNVPITTIHDWTSGIVLTDKQREIIKRRIQFALQTGRKHAQEQKILQRQKKQNNLLTKGILETRGLTKRELFIAGVALYWGEGFKNKHEHRLGFCNSDPAMLKFYLLWLRDCLQVHTEDITLRLTLNEVYKDRISEFEQYWSEFLNIPLHQFSKPFYQKSIWKRQYKTDTYRGVLRIHVKSSLDKLVTMRGWIEGLKNNLSA